jgi:hypothetical protein
MALFLFIFHIFYNIQYKHSFNHIHHIHTIHLSVAIRWGLSPSPHRSKLSGKNLPVVPSRESNSGLPYSKPTLYQLSHAAPPLFWTQIKKKLFLIILVEKVCKKL